MTPLEIAVDARELAGNATGVGRYLTEILQAWDASPDASALSVHLIAHAAIRTPPTRHLHVETVIDGGTGGTWWEQTTLPRLVRRTPATVLFAPAYTAPLRSPVPVVVTVHDVSFCAHPEWFSWREGTRRRLLTRAAARRAACILTVSQFSKTEIVRHLRVPESQVRVVRSGPSGLLLGAAPPSAADAREPMVLYVGSILARRHVPELVSGFARLARRRPDATLVLVGESRGVPHVDVEDAVRRTGLGDRVRHLGFADDVTVAQLYRRASAFAFLSSYEGFGLTPLDALQAGVPPIVLDTPVAREVYGAAAHYLPDADESLVEAALERVLFDPAERARLAAAAPDVVAGLSWRDSARSTLDALRQASR